MDEDELKAQRLRRFAKWVQRQREAAGYATQVELAAAMTARGDIVIPDNYVWQLENMRVGVPRQPRLRMLADALFVTEDDVLRAAGVLPDVQDDATGGDVARYDGFARVDQRRLLDLVRDLDEDEIGQLISLATFMRTSRR